jgi:8-oxo-dGTP pyrophosphatase MutT (NUDIX family)
MVAFTPVRSLDLVVAGAPWRFAAAGRRAIEENFAALRAARPALFNGAMYMLREFKIAEGVLSGVLVRTDYASYLYWRERPSLDPGVRNCFAAAVLHSADGALLLGIMGAHTANAGMIYPPSGSPEDRDIVAGRFDPAGNIAREVAEETGIRLDAGGAGDWLVVEDGPRMAFLSRFDLAADADEAVRAIDAHRRREAEPELAGIHVVRGRGDIVPGRMQAYTRAYIERVFAR